jgi:hypothetical protein
MRLRTILAAIPLASLVIGCADNGVPTSPVDQPTPSLALVEGSGTASQIFSKTAPTVCMDVKGSGTANGTPVLLWTCGVATKANQRFNWKADGTIQAYGGGSLCLQANGTQGNNGDPIVISSCTGATNQKWSATAANEIKGINGKCIAAPSLANNATLALATCSGANTQQWDTNLQGGSQPPTSPPPTGGAVDYRAIAAGIRARGFAQGAYTLAAPVSGGRALHVATTGSDAAAGTATAPFRTIARAAQVARAGDVVTIGSGTYSGSVIVANSGTTTAPNVFQAAQRGGVVLTGGNASFRPATWSGGTQETGQLYVTVRGLIFRRYAANVVASPGPNFPAALKATRGWRVEDCLFEDAGNTAIQIFGSYVAVVKTTIQYSYLEALAAWSHSAATTVDDSRYTPLDGIRITDVVLRGNHALNRVQRAEAADYSSKFLTTRGAVLDNVESFENNGPGFWFDTQNSNFTVRNSYFHHNRDIAGTRGNGRGLNIEANWAPALIERNVFASNQGLGMGVTASQGLTIRNNLFINNPRCMELTSDLPRIATFPLKNIGIYSNQCGNWTNFSGVQTLGGASAFTTPAAMNIKADSNVYQPGSVKLLGWWENKTIGAAYTLTDFQQKWGWEAHGRIGTISWP